MPHWQEEWPAGAGCGLCKRLLWWVMPAEVEKAAVRKSRAEAAAAAFPLPASHLQPTEATAIIRAYYVNTACKGDISSWC